MARYIMKRLLMMVFVLLGVLLITYTLLEMTPGDPARAILGASATDEAIAVERARLHLDDPFPTRFVRYVYNLVVNFDMGISYRTKTPVLQEIATRLPTTLKIGLAGLVISVLIGVISGVISAIRQYSLIDKLTNVFAVIFNAMPSFWLALEMSLLFALKLKWLPATGYKGLECMIMPVMTLGLCGMASLFRQTRSSMLDVIRSDYIRTAKSKGQSEFVIVMHHALKNALIPIITMISGSLGNILAGAVVIESIFAIPGLGNYMLQAIDSRDYPVIMGSVFVLAVSISLVNLVTDILYSFIDPRLKAQFKTKRRRTKGAIVR